MRVVHIDTFDCVGGAARAAYRLHDGLRRIGHDSRMFVSVKTSQDASVKCYVPSRRLHARILRTLRRLRIARATERYRRTAPNGLPLFSDDRSMYAMDPWQQLPEGDVIHLHWIAGFVDYRAFFASVPEEMPLVWTLHDMLPLTGGCHYDRSCGKFSAKCGACPQLGSHSESDLTRQIWKRKQRSLASLEPSRLHIVAPSRWLGEQVKQSSLLSRFPRSIIPNGLDTEVFAPRNRRVAREVLGLPPEATVALFMADGVQDSRKGFYLLRDALAGIQPRPMLFLLSVGSGTPLEIQGFPHVHLRQVDSDRFLSFVYSAADVFVAPSLQDNLPNTILESIACGTPVVGFDVGGIPDAVRPSITGLLAPAKDSHALGRAILELLDDDAKRGEMAENCREIAVQEYDLKIQAARYLKLYEELQLTIGRPDRDSECGNRDRPLAR